MTQSLISRIAAAASTKPNATLPKTPGGYVAVMRGGPHVSACREYADYERFRADVAAALRSASGTLVALMFAFGAVYGELSPAEVRKQFLEPTS